MKRQGVPATSSTFSTLLAACPRGASSAAIHADVAKLGLDAGPFVSTSLVSVYSRLGDVAGAARAFAGAAEKRTELCNAIAGSIAACSLDSGRAIHGLCFKVGSSIAVWTALVAFYARRGAAADSAAVFESVGEKDLPLWGSMIAAQCHVGELRSAVAVLTRMVNAGLTPDSATLAVIAAATARSDRQELGFQVHGYAVKLGLERDTFVGSAMVDFYAKLDLLESAEAAFAAVDEKNLVAWNSILMAYGRSGDVLRCAAAIAEMRAVGLPPDSISITGALIAAVRSAGLLAGKTIHAFQMRNHVICDSRLGNTLIEMYVRCGCLAYARHVFDCLPERTLASWNSMISGYGSHGHCEKAIEVFEEMIRGSDQAPPPDEITFLALISACGHRGWTERGIEIFNLMIHGYKIKPSSKHCAAVADLLGRAGLLDEAFRFAKDLQIPEGDSVWKSLICSSRLHGDVIAGEAAAGQISRFSAEDHVQMWKLYDEAGMPDMAVVEKRKIKAQKLKKTPGCSWIEVRGSVEVFFSGGSYSSSSPLGDVTRELIFSLNRVLKDERIYT
ncbi:pentatricopeptide repeat-containing protein At2g40720-like [Wolffia australiana]